MNEVFLLHVNGPRRHHFQMTFKNVLYLNPAKSH